MTRGTNRLWPVLVVVLFCLPLFYGLDHIDLRGDEAAHSFSVDRILETGDWLIPRISPSDYPFVEKPPLKFWIVAAGIRLGLPHNEIGMRVWDALFASIAFLYVFLIGRRLMGPLCGAVAAMLLIIHLPLVIEHGVRDNDMEAALLLSYCGGIYHYLVWGSAGDGTRARRHAVAVGLYFVLGFMVKFVAAGFLPIVVGVASLTIPTYRRRLGNEWRLWGLVSLLCLVLIAPWYLYGYSRFGRAFWDTIFGQHVYVRLLDPAGLDSTHLHRWDFYFTQLYENLKMYNIWPLTLAGAILLVGDTLWRRSREGAVVLLWFALPVSIISLASSKLYHYEYPYLPPVALAGAFLPAWIWSHLDPIVRRFVTTRVPLDGQSRLARLLAGPRHAVVRQLLLAVALAAVAILAWTVVFGPIRVRAGGIVFKSGSILRPWIIAVLFGVLAGRVKEVAALLGVPILVVAMLPLPTYRDTLERLSRENHPAQSARACIEQIRAGLDPSARHPVYVTGPDSAFGHGHFYYFRALSEWVPLTNWVSSATPSDDTLYKYLYDPAEMRPVLIEDTVFTAFRNRLQAGAIPIAREPRTEPGIARIDDATMVLPGPYASCGASPSP